MKLRHAAASLFARLVLLLVIASSNAAQRAKAARDDAPPVPAPGAVSAFVRAALGFTGSLLLMLFMLTALGAHVDDRSPQRLQVALRASIH